MPLPAPEDTRQQQAQQTPHAIIRAPLRRVLDITKECPYITRDCTRANPERQEEMSGRENRHSSRQVGRRGETVTPVRFLTHGRIVPWTPAAVLGSVVPGSPSLCRGESLSSRPNLAPGNPRPRDARGPPVSPRNMERCPSVEYGWSALSALGVRLGEWDCKWGPQETVRYCPCVSLDSGWKETAQ